MATSQLPTLKRQEPSPLDGGAHKTKRVPRFARLESQLFRFAREVLHSLGRDDLMLQRLPQLACVLRRVSEELFRMESLLGYPGPRRIDGREHAPLNFISIKVEHHVVRKWRREWDCLPKRIDDERPKRLAALHRDEPIKVKQVLWVGGGVASAADGRSHTAAIFAVSAHWAASSIAGPTKNSSTAANSPSAMHPRYVRCNSPSRPDTITEATWPTTAARSVESLATSPSCTGTAVIIKLSEKKVSLTSTRGSTVVITRCVICANVLMDRKVSKTLAAPSTFQTPLNPNASMTSTAPRLRTGTLFSSKISRRPRRPGTGFPPR